MLSEFSWDCECNIFQKSIEWDCLHIRKKHKHIIVISSFPLIIRLKGSIINNSHDGMYIHNESKLVSVIISHGAVRFDRHSGVGCSDNNDISPRH